MVACMCGRVWCVDVDGNVVDGVGFGGGRGSYYIAAGLASTALVRSLSHVLLASHGVADSGFGPLLRCVPLALPHWSAGLSCVLQGSSPALATRRCPSPSLFFPSQVLYVTRIRGTTLGAAR